MEKINDAIKCVNCRSVLTSPVLLPCGHSICKNHSQTSSADSIRCGDCGIEHQIPNGVGFPEIKSLALIISTEIHNINLGEAHEKAKTGCKSLESLIKQVNLILADPTNQTREEIDGMKNEIYLKREQLKLEIDQETDLLIGKLEQYLQRFLSQPNEKEFKQFSTELASINNTKILDECKNLLDLVSLDEAKWKRIYNQVADEHQKLNDKLQSFRQSLIMPDFADVQYHTRLFIDFKLNFIRPGQLYSNIIDSQSLQSELTKVCEFQSNQRFDLLYRGSENNFSWAEFHRKCDNKSPTLVIVKTVDGCIFGGYTNVNWNPKTEHGQYISDFEAFLFSLKSSESESKKYRVKDNNRTLYYDKTYGLCFGHLDLGFDNNGNAWSTLNSNISEPGALRSQFGVPFTCRQFKVIDTRDIEVFQELSN